MEKISSFNWSVYNLDPGYEDEILLHLNFYRKCQRVEVNIYLSYKICPSSSQSTSSPQLHYHHNLCTDQCYHCPDYDVVVTEVTSFCNQDPLIIFTRAAAASREQPRCFYDKLVRVHDEQGWIFVYLLISCSRAHLLKFVKPSQSGLFWLHCI